MYTYRRSETSRSTLNMRQILAGLMMCLALGMVSSYSALAGTWSDGFEGEELDEGWEIGFDRPTTTFKMENGELTIEVHNSRIGYLRVTGSNEWKNYTVKVRVKIMEIFGPLVDGGIMIYESGFSNWVRPHYYYFFIADNWELKEWQKVGEVPYPGIPPEGEGAFVFPFISGGVRKGKAKVFKPELDHWYTLKATAEPGRAAFYVDDELVGEFNHRELNSGSVGLIVSNALVQFDDFVVAGEDIPDGGPGGASFPVEPKSKLATRWGRIKEDDHGGTETRRRTD